MDVRVVVATNRDLGADAAAGRFREDLLYRLDVLSVRMPPLRERRDDVPMLVRHVLRDVEERTGDSFVPTARVISVLVAHDWPGNVRELRNVLERAAAFAQRGVIDLEQLPERLRPRGSDGGTARPGLGALLDECERSLVLDRLESNGWNRTRTAGELGITRRCLFNKILRHGLRPGGEEAGAGAGAAACVAAPSPVPST